MQITEEMQIMIDLLKGYSNHIVKNKKNANFYFAPDIPDNVFTVLVEKFDNNMLINSVIAFFDEKPSFKVGQSGLLFTVDGMYYRHSGSAMYFAYKDLRELEFEKDCLTLTYVDNEQKENEYKLKSAAFDMNVLDYVLRELNNIDNIFGQTTEKLTGKVQKTELPNDIQVKCHAIIHSASVACGGVGTGLAQIPLSDTLLITPIQIGMITSIGAVFHMSITEAAAKSIIASAGASIAGRAATQLLVGWIPGLGNAINTATAAGVTEAIGWIAVKHFYDKSLQKNNTNRFQGMKAGYAEASEEYENKYKKLAEEFLTQTKNFNKQKAEYEQLIKDLEEYIERLEKEKASYAFQEEVKSTYNSLVYLKRA